MITKLEANGYRLLDQFTADLGKLTVVIGANATGKSTLIDCLRCTGDCAEFPLQQAIEMHGGIFSIPSASSEEMKIKWRIEFHEPVGAKPLTSPPPHKPRLLTYEVAIEGMRTGEVIPTYEVLRTSEPLDEQYDTPFKYLEVVRSRAMIYDFRQHNLVPLEEALRLGESAEQPSLPGLQVEQAEEREDAAVAQGEGPSLQLRQMRFPVHKVFGLASRVRSFLTSIAFYPGFSVGSGSELRTKPAPIRPDTLLLYDGRNLGTVLHEILTRYNYRESAGLLKDFIRVAYPSFEEISAETAYGAPPSVLVRVREKDMRRSMELWDLSDGMLRFLCLAAALLNPLPPPFVAIDEPETGLHPRLMPVVADMIKVASEKMQVMVTTHSPDLLSRFDLDEVAVMARDGPRSIWRRPASRAGLRQMLEGVAGESLGDLLRSGELEEVGE